MPSERCRSSRPSIIRALHGVSASGDWFLMADLAPKHDTDGEHRPLDEPVIDDTWLVILGHRDRDIIIAQDPIG